MIGMLLCAAASAAVPPRRYGPFSKGVVSPEMAAFADGGRAVAFSGSPGGVFTLDPSGQVVASRGLGASKTVRFVATSATSDRLYAGVAGLMAPEFHGDLIKFRRDLTVEWALRMQVNDAPVLIDRGVVTADGGITIAGRDDWASVVVKLDAKGHAVWGRKLDFSGEEELRAIRELPGGEFLAAGGGGGGAWLVRLGADGEVLWQHSYMPFHSFQSMIVARDGSIVCAEATSVVKLDSSGRVMWRKVFTQTVDARSLMEAGDGFAVLLAEPSATSIKVVKLKATDGSLQWQRTLQPGAFVIGSGSYPTQSSMMVPHGAGITLAVGLNEFVSLFQLEGTTGRSECRWFAEAGMRITDQALRRENAAVEVTIVDVRTVAINIEIAPLVVGMATEKCPAGAPHVDPHAPPSSPMSAFRVYDREKEKEYMQLLLQRKFAELDEIAAGLRRSRGGDPVRPGQPLERFYVALTTNEVAEHDSLAALREWVSARPHSFTARIALANALVIVAERRRGAGFISPTATGLAGYTDFMRQAAEMLASAGNAAESDNHYWAVRLQLAGQIGTEDVREVARRGLAAVPDPRIASLASIYLLPEWGGSTEELFAFVEEAVTLLPDPVGSALYASMARWFWSYEVVRNLKDEGFDWERTKKGFEDLIRLNPEWLPSYHKFGYLVRYRDDFDTARPLFQRPQMVWYEDANDIWPRESFDRARQWALPPLSKTLPVEIISRPTSSTITPPLPVTQSTTSSMPQTPLLPSAPFIATPPAKWPRFVAERKRLIDGPADGDDLAFVVEHTGRLVAIALEGKTAPQARAFATLKSKEAPEPLQIRTLETAPLFGPVYVLACKRSGGRCVQTVLKGKWVSMVGGRPEERITLFVALEAVPEETVMIRGAAVIDQHGSVLGAVTSRNEKIVMEGVKYLLEASDVSGAFTP